MPCWLKSESDEIYKMIISLIDYYNHTYRQVALLLSSLSAEGMVESGTSNSPGTFVSTTSSPFSNPLRPEAGETSGICGSFTGIVPEEFDPWPFREFSGLTEDIDGVGCRGTVGVEEGRVLRIRIRSSMQR